MRLTDLEPRWFAHGDEPHAVFVFNCPHCCATGRRVRLSCTVVAMKGSDQRGIFDAAYGEDAVVVGCKFLAWTMVNGPSFETMTITPSLDASAAGHWHGFITNGAIVGGI